MTTAAAGRPEPEPQTDVTHYFDPPVAVTYRTHRAWRTVVALAVRRTETAHTVLIALTLPDGSERAMWVPRARIRSAPV